MHSMSFSMSWNVSDDRPAHQISNDVNLLRWWRLRVGGAIIDTLFSFDVRAKTKRSTGRGVWPIVRNRWTSNGSIVLNNFVWGVTLNVVLFLTWISIAITVCLDNFCWCWQTGMMMSTPYWLSAHITMAMMAPHVRNFHKCSVLIMSGQFILMMWLNHVP